MCVRIRTAQKECKHMETNCRVIGKMQIGKVEMKRKYKIMNAEMKKCMYLSAKKKCMYL